MHDRSHWNISCSASSSWSCRSRPRSQVSFLYQRFKNKITNKSNQIVEKILKINKLDKKRFPRLRRDEIGSLWKKSWFEENKFDARRRCVALICFEVGSSGDGLCEYCDLFKIDWWVSIGPWPILLTFYDCILRRTNCKFIVIENSRVVIYDWSPMGHYCSPI